MERDSGFPMRKLEVVLAEPVAKHDGSIAAQTAHLLGARKQRKKEEGLMPQYSL